MMKAKGYLPFHLDHIPSKIIQKAKEELNETNETRAAALEKIREYIKEDKNLKCPMEDEYLLQFLRARKFDSKRAFALLQNKYQVKKSYPELYDSINLDDLRKVYSSGAGYCFPFRDPDGCVVLVLALAKWNPGESNICNALTALTGFILSIVDEPATQISGVRILVDVRGFSLRQMRTLTPRYILLLSKALRNCLPVRFKGIHIYNESIVFQYIWSVLKLVLTDKIRNRSRMVQHPIGSQLSVSFYMTNSSLVDWLQSITGPCSSAKTSDITLWDLFKFLGCTRYQVSLPPLPNDVDELQTCISVAFQSSTPDMPKRVWNDISYRHYIVRVSAEACAEHL
ncbi:retinaldehyde-binding protein 1 [Trichonephila inaurata madagascariensis]|uniref:Retinaldehyde-binding protein 1 n=1 Tax=Trichonephila inaurata madagascariensis TaxID=2747483 RepID=A0A8X6X5U0_9ARAC|nr:retinaldehyde-binding protein 1 [Trichonephila inaurata madagascariensis]